MPGQIEMTSSHQIRTSQASVTIIGAGITGLQTAWHLTRLGVRDIVILERDFAGSELYGRFSAGVRRQFGTKIEIELTLASLPFFAEFLKIPEIQAGFEPVGYAFLAGESDREGLRRSWLLQQEMGISSEWLEGAQIEKKFPYIDRKGVVAATFDGADFWLNPWAVHQWLLRTCREAGVAIFEQSPVTAIEVAQGAIRAVTCPGLRLETASVVNAAGARARQVQQMAGSDVPVEPSPRVKYLVKAPTELPRTMPLITDLITGTYVRNEGSEAIVGVKPPAKVTGYDYDTSQAALDWMHHRAGLRYPSLAKIAPLQPSRIITGLYDITPDGLPVAGPDPAVKGLFLAAGFNGHGVMFSPTIARAVAELVALGKTETFDLARLSLARFSDPEMASNTALHLL
jgi:sarcosine oxidase subunit beta